MFGRKNPSLNVNPASTPRNAFDLSERHLYTQCPGMILPVFVKDLNPDEKISVNIASEIQAQTLKGRPFLGMKQQFAAYFVPYRLLWSYWKPFISGLSFNNTSTSSALKYDSSSGTSIRVPVFKPYSLLSSIYKLAGTNPSGQSGFHGAFGPGTRTPNSPAPGTQSYSFPDNYRSDYLGFDFGAGFARLYDMLGYGNLVAMKDGSYAKGLLDYEVNAFRFLAYQKIYQDHFLDDRFEKRDVSSYNVDNRFLNGKTEVSYLESFSPRYAKYNKDLLTNFQSSPLFLSNVDSNIKAFVGESPYMAGSDGAGFLLDSSGSSSSNLTVGAASIRNMFALDKMAQISSRASKTYRAQMLAHYGVNVDDENTISKYCGGSVSNLDPTAVIASADGSAKDSFTQFGQQGSFIDVKSGGHVDFESRDFGVFMIVSWLSVAPQWDSYGVDVFNTKMTKEDYYHPETADLGLQPLTTDQLGSLDFVYSKPVGGSPVGTFNGRKFESVTVSSAKVYGWSPRYSEYKSSYDKVHGEFRNPVLIDKGNATNTLVPFTTGSLSFMALHTIPPYHGSANPVSLDTISIRPDVLNDVVEVAYNGLENTDPFRVDTNFSCSVIRNMSVNGLPRIQ